MGCFVCNVKLFTKCHENQKMWIFWIFPWAFFIKKSTFWKCVDFLYTFSKKFPENQKMWIFVQMLPNLSWIWEIVDKISGWNQLHPRLPTAYIDLINDALHSSSCYLTTLWMNCNTLPSFFTHPSPGRTPDERKSYIQILSHDPQEEGCSQSGGVEVTSKAVKTPTHFQFGCHPMIPYMISPKDPDFCLF